MYLFGFSRVAFTARSIAGMIRKCRILDRLAAEYFAAARALYRIADETDDAVCQEFRKKNSIVGDTTIPIQMIGVCDTVGALGSPVRGLRGLTADKYEFHERNSAAPFYALAIDERRVPFLPTIWDAEPKKLTIARGGQQVTHDRVIEQVWLLGVHTDVDGGYPETGLSDITMEWMIGKSRAVGLAFDRRVMNAHSLHPDPTLNAHNSRKGLNALTKGVDRGIGRRSRTFNTGSSGAHDSTRVRMTGSGGLAGGRQKSVLTSRVRRCPNGHDTPEQQCPTHQQPTRAYRIPAP